MAEVLDGYEFIGGRRAAYPWTLWQDGRVWKIKRGVDFEVAASSMQAQLHVRAKTRGMRVSTSASGPVGAEDTVVFQFTPILAGVECG
jgi:hypothetical protein